MGRRRPAQKKQKLIAKKQVAEEKIANSIEKSIITAQNDIPSEVDKNILCTADTVMSIHGWLSDNRWQSNFSEQLSRNKLHPAPYHFKNNWWPWVTDFRLQNFQKWYFEKTNRRDNNINLANHFLRPSIIAHSLGTWIVALAMKKYPEIKFDKIILLGSIVPFDFDWNELIIRDQVNDIIYEKAEKDNVAYWSWIVTKKWRASVKYGFAQKSDFIEEVSALEFGHGTFQYAEHFVTLIKEKLLKNPPLPLVVIQGGSVPNSEVAKTFLSQATLIDNLVYTDPIYQASPINISRLIEWFEVEKNIWIFLKNCQNGQIDGYINAIPVDKQTYDDFVSGNLEEKDIPKSSILNYGHCSEYYLLVLSVAVKMSEKEGFVIHRGKRAQLLIMAMIDKIERYNLIRCQLKKIAAVAWTDTGARLCKGFGMTIVRDDGRGHGIYEIDMDKLEDVNTDYLDFLCKEWYEKLLSRKN